MKKLLFLLSIAIIALASCKKVDIGGINTSGIPVFHAVTEGQNVKTFVDNNHKLLWTANDNVSIFFNTYNHQYVFKGETGSNSGDFELVKVDDFHAGATLGANYAVYPYSAETKISTEELITLNLPSTQAYAENSFGLGANTMVAVTSDTEDTFLYFKNVCGFLVVKLYGQGSVKSITLKGNNAEKIAGPTTISASYDNAPEAVMAEDATESITIDCGEEGVVLGTTDEEAKEFWFCVPPTVFSNGFTVSISGTNGQTIEKSITSEKTISRNLINSLSALEVDFGTFPDTWEVVETQSWLKNGLFGMFASLNPDNLKDYLLYPVSVEKRTGLNIFRVKNITKSSVCPYFEACDLDGDMYFIIDATDPNFVTVENCGLKVCLNDAYGEAWAGTDCSPFAPEYKVGGTYDAEKGMIRWRKGQLYCWMPDYGPMEKGNFWDCYETVLWLDEDKMVEFAVDYEFVEFLPDTYQKCSAFDFEYGGAPVYVGVPKDPSKTDELAEKYGTVYYIPDYVSNGYGIYFNIDKNKNLALPDYYKTQDLGCQVETGVYAYMVIRDVTVSSGGVTIDYDIADQNGNIIGRNYTDKFLTYVEAGIDDFVGEYTCPSLNNATVTVTKISDTELSFAGISQDGPFKFMMDGGYPSFVGGLINETSNYYAYIGNLSGSFYSGYYNVFNYKMLPGGTLIPSITSLGSSNKISHILILSQTSQGWAKVTSYAFADLKLLPVEDAAPLSVIPDMSRKLADYKGVTKTGLRFNGKPVSAKTVSNRKPYLAE